MLIKFANADLLEARVAHRGDTLMRTAHRAVFNYEPREGFLYVRSRAISSRTNDNFDTWPAEELVESWQTFIGKPVFVNHHNKDHRRARGVIIDAVLHRDTAPDGTPDTWVEVLMEVDAVRFPKLAAAILAGDIERTSMGADVGESECSYCGNVATTPDTYCVHVSRHKGQRLVRAKADGTKEDVLVHEICRKISFFENSLLVEAPADPTAFFLGVDDAGVRSMGMQMRTASKAASQPTGRASRGFFCDVGSAGIGRKALALYRGLASKSATVEDILSVAASDGHVGSQWALEDEPDFAGWSDPNGTAYDYAWTDETELVKNWVIGNCGPGPSDEIIWDELEDNLGAIMVVLVGKTAAPYQNDYWDADIGIGAKVALDEVRYNAGWGWQTLHAGGRTVTAKDGKDHGNTDKGNTTDRGYGWDHQKKREELLKDNPKCHWCKTDPATEADHYRNGLVPSCSKCNNDRSHEQQKESSNSDAYVDMTPEQRKRFEGTTVRQDSDGFYCHTHRARSDSYPSIDEIPEEAVKFIESTGSVQARVVASAVARGPEKDGALASKKKAAGAQSFTVAQDGGANFFELHITGCGDLSKAKYQRSDKWTFEADDWRAALDWVIDDQMIDQGYSKDDVTVFACAKSGIAPQAPVLDPSQCPASGRAIANPRRLLRMPCPECGKMIGGARNMLTKIPRHTPLKSASLVEAIADQMKCEVCGYSLMRESGGWSHAPRTDRFPNGYPPGANVRHKPRPIKEDQVSVAIDLDDDGLTDFGRSIFDWSTRKSDEMRRKHEAAMARGSVSKLAWGEMKAPAVVDTLGLVECPVCGERSKFDTSGRCTVCGFLPPPEPFREPDLDVAQKVDMRDGWINPDLMAAPAFTPPEEGDEGSSPVQDATPPNQGAERTGGTRMRPSEAIQRNAVAENARLRAENAALRARQQRRADINNPGQPVPEPAAQSGVSTDEARKPDATADVTSTSGAALPDVGPATTTDVTAPGAALTDVAPMATADVTAPVAGGAEPQSYADSVIKIEPDASGGTDSSPAFAGDNSWVQAKRQARAEVFAALRLARLRINAGIERGDDLAIAEKIASTVKPEAVRNEIATLTQVVRQGALQQQQRQASRPHVAQRSTPSLASMAVPGIQAVGGFAGLAVSDEEVGLFD